MEAVPQHNSQAEQQHSLPRELCFYTSFLRWNIGLD
jgi:hypothetical protein